MTELSKETEQKVKDFMASTDHEIKVAVKRAVYDTEREILLHRIEICNARVTDALDRNQPIPDDVTIIRNTLTTRLQKLQS